MSRRFLRTSRPAVLLTVLASLLGAALVQSPAFAEQGYAAPASGAWQVTGHGFGHGRGMSQYGAHGAAAAGLNAAQILDFYYPGTTSGTVGDVQLKVDLTPFRGGRVDLSAPAGQTLYVRDAAGGADSYLGTGRWAVTVDAAGVHLSQVTAGGLVPRALGGSTAHVGPLQFATSDGVNIHDPASGTGRWYRGSLNIERSGATGLRSLNLVSLESYLMGVVPKEMPPSFRSEALGAQAVAARTYAMRVSSSGQKTICDTISCQVYQGRATVNLDGKVTAAHEAASTNTAVAQSRGVVRTYGGGLALLEYSSSNGGYTASGGSGYTPAKRDPYDAGAGLNPNVTWKASLPVSTVQAACPSGGKLQRLVLTTRNGLGDWGGRLSSARVECTTGSRSVDPRFGLKSSWYSLGEEDRSPFGSLDSASAPGVGLLQVSGWLIDPDTTDPVGVHVYVDGRIAHLGTASGTRRDVAAVYPGWGDQRGYSVQVPVFPGGVHQVCVYGINVGPAAPNSLVGCRTVTLPTGQPLGSVDSVSSPAPGRVRAQGWSLDPDSPGQVQVHGYLDGRIAFITTAGTSRGDLAVAFPAHGAKHGYDVTIPASSGRHELCVYAINTGAPATNPLLACRSVVVG